MEWLIQRILLFVLAVGLMMAGINHFWHPQFYLRIMPAYLPFPVFLVYISGIAEIVLGVLLVPAKTRRFAALLTTVLFTVFLLIHADMLIKAYTVKDYHVSIKNAWIRLLLQPVLMRWAWYMRSQVIKDSEFPAR